MTAGPYQLLPPLSDVELLALRESIDEHGVLVPIIIDENGAILDGHHRKLVADTIGAECPQEVRTGLSEAEKRTLAYGLNVNRRQMDTATKRSLVADSLRSDPELSDRQHAARVGVDHKTVATARGSLERRGEIPHVEERTDTKGRKVGAKPAPQTSPDAASSADGDRTGEDGSAPVDPGATSPGQNTEPPAGDADGSAEQANATAASDADDPDPSPSVEGSGSPHDLHPTETLRVRGSKAVVGTRKLLAISPEGLAAVVLREDIDAYRSLASEMEAWGQALKTALTQPLRSVQ